MECCNLNTIHPHNHIGNGTIRKFDFVGVGMALLEKAVGFEVYYAQDTVQ